MLQRQQQEPDGASLLCRYDPYARVMLKETYDHQGMRAVRKAAIPQGIFLAHCCDMAMIPVIPILCMAMIRPCIQVKRHSTCADWSHGVALQCC